MFCFSTSGPLSNSLPLSLPHSSPIFPSRGPDKFALDETFDSCDEFRHGRAGGREGGTRDGGRELNCLQKLRDSYITAGRPLCAPSLSRPIPIRTLLLMWGRRDGDGMGHCEIGAERHKRPLREGTRRAGWSPSQSLSKVEANGAQWLGRIGDPPRPRAVILALLSVVLS